MKLLQLHSVKSAPQKSRHLLESSIEQFGWIPNQTAYMAESDNLLSSYQFAHNQFSNCSLSEKEKAVVWITVGIINNCTYTVQAHEWIALNMGVDNIIIESLAKCPTALEEKLFVLHEFTKSVATAQGIITIEDAKAFMEAGYTRQNMLDVILGVSQKTMSTLLNSIAGTNIDTQFIIENKAEKK
jgi:AhpD family alkylhydroperoxidase